jgi:hypothetical protein
MNVEMFEDTDSVARKAAEIIAAEARVAVAAIALQFLTAYQHDGSKILGAYNDKRDQTATPNFS